MSRDLEAVGRFLTEVLNREPYRPLWLRYADRVRPGRVNAGAVAEVLSLYLWDSGLRSETDTDLPRQLKDRVSRALRGEVLSAETLNWFAHAFGFSEEVEAELWRRFGEALTPPDDDESVTFNQAHAVITRARPGDRADLYCLVMERRGGAVTFWDVTDGTSAELLQVGLRRDDFTDEEWISIRAIRKGARLRISGVLGVSHAGAPTLWLESFPMIQDYSFPETLDAVEPHRLRIGASLFVASFRNLAEQVLRALSYVQLDVRLLTTDWHGVEGPFTLRALYTGFGEPMFLAPSPSPQLVEALIATGRDKVFTASSLFTSSYRGRPDGSEATVIMAKTLNAPLERLIADSEAMLTEILQGMGVGEDLPALNEWPRTYNAWPERFPTQEIESAQITVYQRREVNTGRTVELARFLIPPGFAPVEVVAESSGRGVALGTIILYLERLLPLVQHLPIRRLHSITPLFDTGSDE